MKKVFRHILKTVAWLLIIVAILLVIAGIFYGYTEYKAFNERQDEYYALQPHREALENKLDSLKELKQTAVETNNADSIELSEQISLIANSEEYISLFGQPEPPRGFSLAWLVSNFVFILSLLPLTIGIVILIAILNKKSKK